MMDDQGYKEELDKSSAEQESTSIKQKNNILQEIKDLEQEIRNSKYQTFKKNTDWHQQTTTLEELKQVPLQKEMIDCLLRIEAKLTLIETLLEK